MVKKYDVHIDVTMSGHIEIEATSEAEAKAKAKDFDMSCYRERLRNFWWYGNEIVDVEEVEE